MMADEMVQKLAAAFAKAGPREAPGRASWLSKPHGHIYYSRALVEALDVMPGLAAAFPAEGPGEELVLPPGAAYRALWPWGERWQMRLIGTYQDQDDTLRLRVDVRRA